MGEVLDRGTGGEAPTRVLSDEGEVEAGQDGAGGAESKRFVAMLVLVTQDCIQRGS